MAGCVQSVHGQCGPIEKTGLSKFRKSILTALKFHANESSQNQNAPAQLQILEHNLMVEGRAAVAAHKAKVVQ
jgi:hypothetical protein